MKTLFVLVLAVMTCRDLVAEEFVTREVSGKSGEHVAVTHFFFDGQDCYGARREYSNLRMHVIVPKIYWDLYFGGELVAVVDPEARSVDYMKSPSGAEIRKELSRFILTKDGKILRIWEFAGAGLKILPSDELARLSEKSPNEGDPAFAKLLQQFCPRYIAPTKKEADAKMQKTSKEAVSANR